MGCAASTVCSKRSGVVDPVHSSQPEAKAEAVEHKERVEVGSEENLSEAVTPQRSPVVDAAVHKGDNDTGVDVEGNPSEWNAHSAHMTSADVRGWLDELMGSASAASPGNMSDSQNQEIAGARQGEPGFEEDGQGVGSPVVPFNSDELEGSVMEGGADDSSRPFLRSGILSIEASPIPLSMNLDKMLSTPENINDIQLKGCQISDLELQSLLKAMRQRGAQGLTLARCSITDAQAAELARFVQERDKTARPLQQLGLDGNEGVTDKAATALSVALRANSTLTELSLWGSRIGDAGATALAKALRSNRTLKQLWLGECEAVTDHGAAAFRDALTAGGNTALQQLGLVCSGVSDGVQSELEDLVQSQRR